MDAGGKGYLYILEGMLKTLKGEIISRNAETGAAVQADSRPSFESRDRADFSEFDTKDIQFAYCTEFIVSRKNPKDVNHLRDFLDIRGDSIVVVDDDELIKVHVHSNEPGVIITEALTYGPLITIKIENMREQHSGKIVESQAEAYRPAQSPETDAAAQPAPEPEPVTAGEIGAEPMKKLGVVAGCAGEGRCNVFRDSASTRLFSADKPLKPSTEGHMTKSRPQTPKTVFVRRSQEHCYGGAQCARLRTRK